LFLVSPLHDVVGVHGKAEEIGGDKASLRGFHPDIADDQAVCACHEPAVPHAATHQDGGADREDTRKVIEAKHGALPSSSNSGFFGIGQMPYMRA